MRASFNHIAITWLVCLECLFILSYKDVKTRRCAFLDCFLCQVNISSYSLIGNWPAHQEQLMLPIWSKLLYEPAIVSFWSNLHSLIFNCLPFSDLLRKKAWIFQNEKKGKILLSISLWSILVSFNAEIWLSRRIRLRK